MPKAERVDEGGSRAFQRFESAVREILTVSKDELNRRHEKWQKRRKIERPQKTRIRARATS